MADHGARCGDDRDDAEHEHKDPRFGFELERIGVFRFHGHVCLPEARSTSR
jgi:hypothetical protein